MRKTPILALLVLVASCGVNKDKTSTRYVSSDRPYASVYSIDKKNKTAVKADSLLRGTLVEAVPGRQKKVGKRHYIKLADSELYIDRLNLCEDARAVVLEKEMYVRSASSVISDTVSSKICALANKGEKLAVLGYDTLDTKGRVIRYLVQCGEEQGWVYGKYLVGDPESALKNYKSEVYDSVHLAIKDRFGAGEAIGCDFYPHEKPVFKKKPMPKACYSLYLNFSPSVIGKIDEYIALAKETRINTFVIDIKDNECPGYKAEAMRLYSPTNYAHASKRGEELYARAVRRLHEEGFYVVGRITCFKDSYFVKDHPESAITELATGEPFKHNKSYWPSAFDRAVWQFNVELAKESVRKFGFDEINFDYVRFPDRMTRIEDKIDYHNRYGETKVQAIQRFVTYACDEIHAVGAYVSIDVFGECANPGYTTAYGQYWPALSNVADVMCGMPYPDHFPDGFYGVSKPWNNPFEILSEWGKRVNARQSVTPSPAKVRTWVQAYHVMKHVDPNGIDYNAENIEKEIRGLYSVGLKDGYTTWLSSSNIEKYRTQAAAFCIDYLEEYR